MQVGPFLGGALAALFLIWFNGQMPAEVALMWAAGWVVSTAVVYSGYKRIAKTFQ
jgi:hypothetical protein